MKFVSLLLALLATPVAFANRTDVQVPTHGFTAEQNEEMVLHNAKVYEEEFLNGLTAVPLSGTTATRRPYAEYEQAGYLIFNDVGAFSSSQIKLDFAKYAPSDVTVVVYTASTSADYQRRLFNTYAQHVPKERLKIIQLPGANDGFWARDGIPIPAWTTDKNDVTKFTVVDAKYYYPFEADAKVGQFFNADVVGLPYYNEGGNFMNNSKGDCIVVNNVRAVLIPDQTYGEKYGCKTVLRFPHIRGIGHIDETLKFVDDDTVITDEVSYVDGLRNAGFEVIMLPRPNRPYETYANAVLMNGVAYVPVFNQANDEQALQVYRDLGYTAYPMNSTTLSNQGKGSLHCITMTYPPVPFNELLAHTSAEDVTPL